MFLHNFWLEAPILIFFFQYKGYILMVVPYKFNQYLPINLKIAVCLFSYFIFLDSNFTKYNQSQQNLNLLLKYTILLLYICKDTSKSSKYDLLLWIKDIKVLARMWFELNLDNNIVLSQKTNWLCQLIW